MTAGSPRADLALDPEAVLALVAPILGRERGFTARVCRAEILKRKPRRLVVRYELDGEEGSLALVGKWYATERGEEVWSSLQQLRAGGFAGPTDAVATPVAYLPDHRVLFVDAVEGLTLRKMLARDPASAARAGAWLARFHRSPFKNSRDCGPRKQARSLRRWSERVPSLAPLASALLPLLEGDENPGLPVHYDYYHAQVLLPDDGPTTIVDLDEAGMGDPAFDVAHFLAQLRMLGVRRTSDPSTFAAAEAAFIEAYETVGPLPEVRPVSDAVIWMKLASQALHRGDAPSLAEYAVSKAERSVERVTSRRVGGDASTAFASRAHSSP